MSWWNKHKKELLGGVGLLGLGATGFGLAGMGPLAGLLGESGTALGAGFSGAKLGADMAGPTTAGAKGLMGIGAMAGGAPLTSGQSSAALMGMNLLNQPQQPPQPMAPPPPPAPPPQSNFAGYGQQPPPGIDAMTWAQLPDHLKKQLMMGRQA